MSLETNSLVFSLKVGTQREGPDQTTFSSFQSHLDGGFQPRYGKTTVNPQLAMTRSVLALKPGLHGANFSS